MTPIVLVGTSGFIGSSILRQLDGLGLRARGGYRTTPAKALPDMFRHGDLDTEDRWDEFFAGAAVVVHAAGPAQIPAHRADVGRDRRAIVDGTLNLLRGAANAGVRRVVYLSSAHAYGSSSPPSHRFVEADPLTPHGPYAEAKAEADRLVLEEASRLGIEAVAIRPPMVYGPSAPGNFGRLVKLAKLPLPLPLGAATAKRSFVAVDNLASAIVAALRHEGPLSGPFNVTDDHDLSTSEMVSAIREGLGVRDWQLPVPRRILDLAAGALGRREEVGKLFDPYRLDPGRFISATGWRPPLSALEAVRRAAAGSLEHGTT